MPEDKKNIINTYHILLRGPDAGASVLWARPRVVDRHLHHRPYHQRRRHCRLPRQRVGHRTELLWSVFIFYTWLVIGSTT